MSAPATVTTEPRRNNYFCAFCKHDWLQDASAGNPRDCPSCGNDSHIREIIVSLEFPPIPRRDWDYRAFFDGFEESNECGWGPDRNTAINDLISNYGE